MSSRDPRPFVLLVWRNVKWLVETGGPIPSRWSCEMRYSGKGMEYHLNGTVLVVDGTVLNVSVFPLTRTGRAIWECDCGSIDQPEPCAHVATVAREWILHLESLPSKRKLVTWLKNEERNLPNEF